VEALASDICRLGGNSARLTASWLTPVSRVTAKIVVIMGDHRSLGLDYSQNLEQRWLYPSKQIEISG
jgi:hypothetical protein